MLAPALLHLICLKQAGESTAKLIRTTQETGRVVTVAESPDSKVRPVVYIAPGQPPVLTFRLYEAKLHGRAGNAELMLDDAGH